MLINLLNSQIIKHALPNHMRGSIVSDVNHVDNSVDGGSTSRWRTEYIEKFCDAGAAVVSRKSNQNSYSDDTLSVASIKSSGSKVSTTSRSASIDSRGITTNIHRAARNAAVKNLSEGGSSKTSTVRVVGDQMSRGSSVISVDDAESISDNYELVNYVPEEPIAAVEPDSIVQASPPPSASMSGPLPVRFHGTYSTEYRDCFQQREPLSPNINYGKSMKESSVIMPISSSSREQERPKTEPVKSADARRVPSTGLTEHEARFAWPDSAWYQQSRAVIKKAGNKSDQKRSMSTGRLGMSRNHYDKTWWNENQAEIGTSTTSNPKESVKSFATDSLERGSGCIVAGTPEKISRIMAPACIVGEPAVCSPDSVSCVYEKQKKLSPARFVFRMLSDVVDIDLLVTYFTGMPVEVLTAAAIYSKNEQVSICSANLIKCMIANYLICICRMITRVSTQ